MTNEQKSLWLIYIAGGMLAAMASFIVADQIKTNKARETPCPVASQSASSQPLVSAPSSVVPSPSDQPPAPSTSLPRAPTKPCSDDWTCDCGQQGMPCIVINVTKKGNASKSYYCMHGLWLTREEYDSYGDMLYRNACRPEDRPVLKLCRFGEICATQGIKDGDLCMAEHEQLSICHCGMVFNFSAPDLRKDTLQIRCLEERTCDPPPSEPISL